LKKNQNAINREGKNVSALITVKVVEKVKLTGSGREIDRRAFPMTSRGSQTTSGHRPQKNSPHAVNPSHQ
jgi:hypothetical protein